MIEGALAAGRMRTTRCEDPRSPTCTSCDMFGPSRLVGPAWCSGSTSIDPMAEIPGMALISSNAAVYDDITDTILAIDQQWSRAVFS